MLLLSKDRNKGSRSSRFVKQFLVDFPENGWEPLTSRAGIEVDCIVEESETAAGKIKKTYSTPVITPMVSATKIISAIIVVDPVDNSMRVVVPGQSTSLKMKSDKAIIIFSPITHVN